MPSQRSVQWLKRLYHLVLVIYPKSFRRRYAQSLLSDVQDAYLAARSDPYCRALVKFWMCTATDVVHTALAERWDQWRVTRGWLWLMIGLLGIGLGAFDYHVIEVQTTLLLALPVTLMVGYLAPDRSWRWALVLGLSFPTVHLIGHLLHLPTPYHDAVLASGLALLPVSLGITMGTVLRRRVTQAADSRRSAA